MAGAIFKLGLSVVVLLAVGFQVFLKDIIWLGLGVGRVTEPLSNFPYTCRRIVDPRLEACEDMWLSEVTRQLFLACSDPRARPEWMPNVAHLNLSGRSQKDALVALDIDAPFSEGYAFRELKTPGFAGAAGDGLLSLVGMTGVDYNDDEGRIELFVVSNQPSVDAQTGEYLDQPSVGANTTIELFETGRHATELKHVRTYAHRLISTPNRIAASAKGSFYITNDHGQHKLGLRHYLSPFLGNGNVVFCEKTGSCKVVAGGLNFPNGLIHGADGLLYVPDSVLGTVTVFRPLEDNNVEKVDVISLGYSIDNLSIDSEGDIYVAVFPKGVEIFKAYNDPYNAHPPAAALRIQKKETGYVVEKIIEDAHGEALPAATTVVHDGQTGRLFFSSVISPYIAVCEPN